MEALEAEILAVTENSNRDTRKDTSDSSESAGEFDGVIDSDGGDDDDANLDDGLDDDDDADDAEYGIDDDDDDDDYASRRKAKKRSSRPLKQKSRSSSKSKSSKSRSKHSDRKMGTKLKQQPTLEEEEDDEFEFEFDQDGYGDAADRERLSKMSEVDRERLISERIDARNKKLLFWKKKREISAREAEADADNLTSRPRSSGRSKQSSKSDALLALAEDKQRKKSARPIDIGSDADSEQERPSQKDSLKEKSELHLDFKPEPHLLKQNEGPDFRYADIATLDKDGIATTTPILLRRDTLIQLSQKPYFSRVVEGLFVRLKVGDSQSNQGSYLVCRITNVLPGKVYELLDSGFKTNQHLYLQSGKQRRPFEINLISSSHPTEREFDTYIERAKGGGIEVPRREEVDRLLKRSYQMIVSRKVTPTEEEKKQHMANIEIVYPERVNWTQKRTEVETALEVKRQELSHAHDSGLDDLVGGYEDVVSRLEKRLVEIRELESKYVLQSKKTNVEVFQNLARRNMKLNEANESLAASRRNYESNKTTVDLFSRFDATGQSYFHIGDQDDGSAMAMSEQAKDAVTLKDWRKDLVTWEPTAKRQKISEFPLDAAYGVDIPGLDFLVVDDSDPIVAKRAVSFCPPGIDAVYDRPMKQTVRPPTGAKILSFEEWSKQRAA